MRVRSRRRLFGHVLVAAFLGVGGTVISLGPLQGDGFAAPEHATGPATGGAVAKIVDYPTAPNTWPAALTSGPEGRLWFTRDISKAAIGSFDPATGGFDYYALNQGIYAFKAQGIAVGPHDHLWISANGTYAYQFDPATSASENYREPVGGAQQSVTFGPDGDMWFTGGDVFTSGCRLYSVDPTTAVFTPHVVTSGSCYLFGISTGPDDAIWFTDPTHNAVGEFDPSTGKATEYPIPTPNAQPNTITEGSDHALWFTETNTNKIGRIDPSTHVVTEYDVPTAGASPFVITSGPDGNLWFTERDHAAIGSVDPSTGAVTEYSVAGVDRNGAQTYLDAIAVGPDGNLWITDEEQQLLRFSLSPTIVTEPSSQSAVGGSTVQFTSTSRGIPAPTVQWQVSWNAGATWSPVSGATSTTLSLTASRTTAGEYRAVFTSSAGSVTSKPVSLTLATAGYWMAGRDGGVFAFGGAPFVGSLPAEGIRPAEPIVALVATPDGRGYWLVGGDGGVFAFGDAKFFGSLPSRGITPNGQVVGMAPTPDGGGYWLITADGDVYAFGDAQYLGGESAGIVPVGIAGTANGYWLADAAGGVTARGTAGNFTVNPPVHPSAPIVAIAGTPSGRGYWLAGTDGGVFALGDAPFLGSLRSQSPPVHLADPITALAPTPDGQGYWLVGTDGGVFAFGDARYAGSVPALGINLTPADAIVSLAAQP